MKKSTPEEVIKALTEEYKDLLKDYDSAPLVNIITGQTTGFGLTLYLNTKYTYDINTLNEIKERFDADELYIKVRRSQLEVIVKVRNFEPTDKHIAKMAHAIGLDNVTPEPNTAYNAYRNGSFYNEPNELWDELVIAGYAKDRRAVNDYRYFVTPKGLQLLAEKNHLMIRETHEYDGITQKNNP